MKVWFRSHDESRDAPGRVCEVARSMYDADYGVLVFIFSAATVAHKQKYAAIRISENEAARVLDKLFTDNTIDLRDFPAYFDDPCVSIH